MSKNKPQIQQDSSFLSNFQPVYFFPMSLRQFIESSEVTFSSGVDSSVLRLGETMLVASTDNEDALEFFAAIGYRQVASRWDPREGCHILAFAKVRAKKEWLDD